MSTERILLHQDNELKARIMGDLSKYKRTFEPVKDAFEQLQIGKLTNDIFTTIAEGKAATLRPHYIKSVEDDLTKTGVINERLRAFAMDGTGEIFAKFEKAANDFVSTDLKPSPYGLDKDRTNFLALDDISYSINDGLFIDEKKQESILEKYCRLYASTDAEKELYHALTAMAPALQTYLTVLKRAGLPFYEFDFIHGKGHSANAYIENFFRCDTRMNVIPTLTAIPWAAGFKAQQERINKRGF